MNDLIRDLKSCNLGIDGWQDSMTSVAWLKEIQLEYLYGQRDITLEKLKAYRR